MLRGDLDDLDALRKGATDADGVVHLANKHDWANPAASNAAERGAVEAIGETLVGTERPFVLASGVAGLAKGRPSTEEDPSPFHGPDAPRGGSENLALDYVGRGVRAVSVRFAPTVHGVARPRVHRLHRRRRPREGRLGVRRRRHQPVGGRAPARTPRGWSRLGLEQAPAGTRLHAVAEEGVPTKVIAEAIGRGLGLPVTSVAPEDAVGHFGFIGAFFAMDLSASSERTRARFGWEPTGPTLVEDIEAGAYFPS